METFNLSFSAKETYKTCPRKYFYGYVLKLPKKVWPWFTLGNFNHLVLEKFHKYIMRFRQKGNPYNKRELMKRAYYSAFRRSLRLGNQGKEPVLNPSQIADTKIMLSRYLKKVENVEPDVLFVESYFELDLGDGITVRGYIDRVDKIDENTFKIVDYKTSKTAYVHDKNDQLSIYALGLKKILNREDIEIWKQLDFLKTGTTSPIDPKGAKHDDAQDEIILKTFREVANEIREKIRTDKDIQQWEWKENPFCFCCDFADRCYRERGPEEFNGYS